MTSTGTALAFAPPRLTDVVSTLHGFGIATFDVAPEALAALLPPWLTPELVTLDDGRRRSLVSAVTFRNTEFHVGFAPFIRLVAEQTNFRAYVRHGDSRAVYFFGTTLGSRFVVMPRYAWRLPWAYGRHETTFDFGTDGRCAAYRWHARSAHGEEHVDAVGLGEPTGRLDGFEDASSTEAVLTHPVVGFVKRTDGRYVTYGVDHGRLVMERASASVARIELFERLGLVVPGQAPHSVLVMPRTHFIVRLPPRRV